MYFTLEALEFCILYSRTFSTYSYLVLEPVEYVRTLHSYLVLKPVEHDDELGALFVHHAPEVDAGGRQRRLCGDELGTAQRQVLQ